MRAINALKSQQQQYFHINNERNESRFEQLHDGLSALQRDMVSWSRDNNNPVQQDITSPMEEASTVHLGAIDNQAHE